MPPGGETTHLLKYRGVVVLDGMTQLKTLCGIKHYRLTKYPVFADCDRCFKIWKAKHKNATLV